MNKNEMIFLSIVSVNRTTAYVSLHIFTVFPTSANLVISYFHFVVIESRGKLTWDESAKSEWSHSNYRIDLLGRLSSSNVFTSRTFILREKIHAIGYKHSENTISLCSREKITNVRNASDIIKVIHNFFVHT